MEQDFAVMRLLSDIFLARAYTDEGDFHHADFENMDTAGLKKECCRTSCRDELPSRKISCDDGYKMKGDERAAKDWERMDENSLKGTCCEELSSECKNAKQTKYGEWKKRVEVLNDVTYLDAWGKSILKAKNLAYETYFLSCRNENKNFATQQQCDTADKGCCFECEADNVSCDGDLPSVSTCADNQPSAFMKKYAQEKCSTSGNVDFGMTSEWFVCTAGLTLVRNF